MYVILTILKVNKFQHANNILALIVGMINMNRCMLGL